MFFSQKITIEKTYAFFLASILIWALIAFFVMEHLMEQQEKYGHLINMSGKQRMLSQRIMLKTNLVIAKNQTHQMSEVMDALTLMKRNHVYLTGHIPSTQVHSIYFAPAYDLDKKVNHFLHDMQEVVHSKNLAALQKIEEKDDLLPLLDFTVVTLQKEYEEKIRTSILAETVIFILAIVTILLEAFYVVFPAIRQIKTAKQEAEQALNIKNEFLANISHEIRTPVNAMLGFIDLLRKRDFDPQTKKYLKVIHESGHLLQAMVSDILDFSKISSSKLRLETHPFNLTENVSNTIELFTVSAATKPLAYQFYIDPLLPDCVEGDIVRLTQIMNNLIGNAIKFTPAGGTVKIKATYDTTKQTFRFAIKDTGIGIHPDKLHAIFEPFEQADNSITRKFGGTGLGLAISMRLVKSMGGELRVDSQETLGSTFIAEIPLLLCSHNSSTLLPSDSL